AGVVPLTVAGAARDQRLVPRDSRLLRSLRQTIDIRHESDDGLTGTPVGNECGGHSRHSARDLEAFLLEEAGHVCGRLELLKSQLGKAENRIDDLLREDTPRIH